MPKGAGYPKKGSPKSGAKYATGSGTPGRPSASPRQGSPMAGVTGPMKSGGPGKTPGLRPQSGSPKSGRRS